jgi:ferritin-like metal-binding protein YciE
MEGTMRIHEPVDLYILQLQDMHNAELQLVRALPRMARAACNQDLQAAFEDHAATTEIHLERAEELLNELGERPWGDLCEGMAGILREGRELMEADAPDELFDAALIVAAQKVEHYEIAAYGALRSFAEMLDRPRHVELLQQTLDEESETDELLSQLALRSINVAAMRR